MYYPDESLLQRSWGQSMDDRMVDHWLNIRIAKSHFESVRKSFINEK